MPQDTSRFAAFPLRARKRAQTRVRLVEALIQRLSDRSLSDIPVSELCAEVEISDATFFNYFPTKAALLTHYVQLWSLQVGLVARRFDAEHDNPLSAIEALYAATAAEVQAHPRVMFEIIAHQVQMPSDIELSPVELVERLLFLDDAPEAATLPDGGIDELLTEWLSQAAARGFLPPKTDVAQVMLAAASVFFGVPLLVGKRQPEAVGPLYAEQLALIWAGARSRYG